MQSAHCCAKPPSCRACHEVHASRNPFMRVVDEDVESFFTRNARYEKWRVDGVSFYDVLSPAR